VDTAVVRYEDSAAPAYPETMLKRHIEGMVLVQYVVDTTGHADTASFRVLQATHLEFAKSVKTTLPNMRFHPAKMGTRLVAQLVEQPFVFKIVDTLKTTRQAAQKKP
jgi:TonB family protein